MNYPFKDVELKSAGKPRRIALWIAKHELSLFFLLTFLFSWTIYLVISQIEISNQTVLSRWLLVAAFGPSFVAVILSGISDPELDTHSKPIQQIILFVLMGLLAGGVEFLDHKWWGHKIQLSLIFVDTILILLVAFVVSGALSARRGTRELLQGLNRWRIGAWWYLAALGLWPALVFAANALARITGLGMPSAPWYPEGLPVIPLIIESLIWYLLFGGPLNEEVGWRAFSLVKLQRRYSPLVSSLIIGTCAGLWHVPLHLMGMYPMGPQGAIIRVFDIPTAIMFTWLFNRTKYSLIPVLLLHAARNTTSLFLARNYITSSLLLLLLSILFIITDKMWRSPKATKEETASN